MPTVDSGRLQPLVPVASGRAYRVSSAPTAAMVTPVLARELERVLESFAVGAGFDETRPVSVLFRSGIFGHHRVGRAADIYGVGGVGLDRWKAQWDHTMGRTSESDTTDEPAANAERSTNLGWRLYKAMAAEGRWAQPYGYPVQLFGPWTRTEGPWRYISDRLLFAHLDHIHAAK